MLSAVNPLINNFNGGIIISILLIIILTIKEVLGIENKYNQFTLKINIFITSLLFIFTLIVIETINTII